MERETRMRALVAALLLPWVAVGLIGRLAYRLAAQHGRDLLEIEALQDQVRQLGGEPVSESASTDRPGLPIGTLLQDFELRDLEGHNVTLHQLRHQLRGRRLLITFFDPRCPFSIAMLPYLADLSPDPCDGRPVPLVLTSGDEGVNQKLFAAYGVRLTVLRQDAMEVGSLYGVIATPAAYLVDEHGATASALALGAEAVLALAGVPDGVATVRPGTTRQTPRSLIQNRTLRSGLTAGTVAPDFRLPRLDGGDLSLAEYGRRWILLVFSDPACGPCTALAPELERIHREFPGLQVFMISRGDLDANRDMVAQYRLTFPIALQRHWDTSRDYGMIAAPIAYLIDEAGVIAANVAVGLEAIVNLAASVRGEEVTVSQR